jgi:hypothetical protein
VPSLFVRIGEINNLDLIILQAALIDEGQYTLKGVNGRNNSRLKK